MHCHANKLLNFVPATKGVASTGLPTLRQPISKALTSIMKYFLNPKSLFLLIVLSMAMWAYLGLLSYVGDPRVADSGLDGSEMHLLELLLLSISLFTLFYLWGCSFIHCFKYKSKVIGVLIAFIWPLTYLYGLYILVTTWCMRSAR